MQMMQMKLYEFILLSRIMDSIMCTCRSYDHSVVMATSLIQSERFSTSTTSSYRNVFVVLLKHVKFCHFRYILNVFHLISAGMPSGPIANELTAILSHLPGLTEIPFYQNTHFRIEKSIKYINSVSLYIKTFS